MLLSHGIKKLSVINVQQGWIFSGNGMGVVVSDLKVPFYKPSNQALKYQNIEAEIE